MRASASTDWTRKIDAAPSSVPIAPPLPPARDVPPRATAAMATSVYEVLELESAVRTSATSTRPAIPANTPPMVKATTRTADRTSVVYGTRVSVRVELGGRRISKQKTRQNKISGTNR